MKRLFAALSSIALIIALVGPMPLTVVAQSQSGSSDELDKATPALGDIAQAQNHNSSRSNRTTRASGPGQGNICDGVTCADGSCVATADECPAASADGATACPAGTPVRC